MDKWIKNIEAEGGEASGFLINAIEEGAIEKLIKDIEEGIAMCRDPLLEVRH